MKKKLTKLIAFIIILCIIMPSIPAKATVVTKLNRSNITITGIGKKHVLTLTAPKGSKVAWKSANPKIATINKSGIVTAKYKGTTNITCSVTTGKKVTRLTCKVTIKVPAKAITFANAKIDKEFNAHILELGTPYDFNAKVISTSKVSPSSDWIRFYVADPTIATVNSKNGIVTPLKEGNTTLYVCAGVNEAAALNPDNYVKDKIGIKVVSPTVSVLSNELTHGKEFAIKFNKPMNAATIINANKTLSSNVSITAKSTNGTLASDPGTLTGVMSDDLQTLYIQSTNAFNGTYNISLNSNILSSTGVKLKEYNNDIFLKDTIAPRYIGFTLDETGLISYINFSEPIDISQMVATDPKKSNNTAPISSSIFTTASNYKLTDDKKSLYIDLSSIAATDKNTVITVKLAGIVDLAGNVTDPYPLTVSMATDTSEKPQASCLSVVRNGNSLVATFNRSIQTPGYAIINGTHVSGTVNTENKKEVIYNLTTAGLTSLTGAVNVTLNNFIAYNAPNTVTQYSTTVSFSTVAILPVIRESSLTTKTLTGVKRTVLTLTYDKNVTLKNASGTLYATSNIDGAIGASTGYGYTATVNGNVVTVVLTGTFVELGAYTFRIPAEFVKDNYNNFTTEVSITTIKISGDTQVLPGPVAIQLDASNTSVIYVTFNNMLDNESAVNVNNYKISGLTIASAKLIANSANSPAIVELTLMPGNTVSDIPYQVTISGIKGYKNSYTTMDTWQVMLNISNNKTLPITLTGTASTKRIIMSCTSTISGSSVVNYTFTSGGKTLTLKSSPVISGTTITFEFEDTITAGSIVNMEPAVNNNIFDMSNRKALNLPYSIVMN